MTQRHRCQQVFTACQQQPNASIRAIAKSTQLSKSSVHRLQQQIQQRNQHPESSFWETDAGNQWLRLLVIATVFVFGIQCGIGCERLSQFFHLLRLHRHIGVSPSSLRTLRSQMEDKIIEFEELQLSGLPQGSRPIDICAAADETFFDKVVLVMMDLATGYILLEEKSNDRTYPTWQAAAQQALSRHGLKVRYLVSDGAPALIKLAVASFECPSIPDLFHVLRLLHRSVGSELIAKLHAARKVFRLAERHKLPDSLLFEFWDSYTNCQLAVNSFHYALHHISENLHPFIGEQPINSANVATRLEAIAETLSSLQSTQQLQDPYFSIPNLANLIPSLASVVDVWWDWVDTVLVSLTDDAATITWVKEHLLPAIYWHQQAILTRVPVLQQTYEILALSAWLNFIGHSLTMNLTPSQRNAWLDWAQWMVAKFHRASSQVEGRNSFLSEISHNRRGLSARYLKVLTIIHNFYLQSSNRSTAANRLFDTTFPNLFDWLLQSLPPLPSSRFASCRRPLLAAHPLHSIPT